MLSEEDLKIDEDMLAQVNEKMIHDGMITPDTMYFDLGLFRDLVLGTLITLMSSKEQYAYFLSRIEAYRDRAFDDIDHVFPELGISTEQMLARLHDPAWHGRIFKVSPVTNFVHTMRGQMAVNMNHSAVVGKRTPITFVVNTYPLTLNAVDHHIIGVFLSRTYGVDVKVVCIPTDQLTMSFLSQFDEFYVYHTQAFMANDEIHRSISELKFIDKRIFAARLYGHRYVAVKSQQHTDLQIMHLIDISTTFRFMHPTMFGVPTEADRPPAEDETKQQEPMEVTSGR